MISNTWIFVIVGVVVAHFLFGVGFLIWKMTKEKIMHMRKTILFLFLIMSVNCIFAQVNSNDSTLLEHYLKTKTLSQIKLYYKQLSDSTLKKHPRWQSAMIDLLIERNHLDSALLEMEQFIQWHKNDRKEEVLRIKGKKLKVEEKILIREKALFEIYQNKSYYKALKFIDAFPDYAKHIKLQDSLDFYKDFTNFNYCSKNKRIKACKIYLDKFPQGRFRDEARILRDSLDNAFYLKILRNGNSSDMYVYINKAYYENYQTEVKAIYHDTLLHQALRTQELWTIKHFIDYFPNDSLRPVFDSILEEKYFQKIAINYKNKKYSWAIDNANTYLKSFPEGKYKQEANKMLYKAKRWDRFLDKEYSHYYLIAGYDSDPAFNLSIGVLKNGFSFYNRLRFYPLRADNERVNIHEYPTGSYDHITPLKSPQQEVFSLSLGAKYNPYNQPLWFYASVGIGSYEIVQQFAGYNLNNGNLEFVENKYFTYGGPKPAFIPEVGLICAIG